MTSEEAYEFLDNSTICLEKSRYTREEAELYCKAYQMALDSLEKQIPKKPTKDKRYTKELCPVCNDFVRLDAGTPMLFCCNCGQALDWSEND